MARTVYEGPVISHHSSQLSKLFHGLLVYTESIFRKMFCQYIAKQQYNPLNAVHQGLIYINVKN